MRKLEFAYLARDLKMTEGRCSLVNRTKLNSLMPNLVQFYNNATDGVFFDSKTVYYRFVALI
jgi:hypothetical protein